MEKMTQAEREALQEIERLKEQAEDPRKIMRIKSLLQQHPSLVDYLKHSNLLHGKAKLSN